MIKTGGVGEFRNFYTGDSACYRGVFAPPYVCVVGRFCLLVVYRRLFLFCVTQIVCVVFLFFGGGVLVVVK